MTLDDALAEADAELILEACRDLGLDEDLADFILYRHEENPSFYRECCLSGLSTEAYVRQRVEIITGALPGKFAVPAWAGGPDT